MNWIFHVSSFVRSSCMSGCSSREKKSFLCLLAQLTRPRLRKVPSMKGRLKVGPIRVVRVCRWRLLLFKYVYVLVPKTNYSFIPTFLASIFRQLSNSTCNLVGWCLKIQWDAFSPSVSSLLSSPAESGHPGNEHCRRKWANLTHPLGNLHSLLLRNHISWWGKKLKMTTELNATSVLIDASCKTAGSKQALIELLSHWKKFLVLCLP